jgi:hypothetical protein
MTHVPLTRAESTDFRQTSTHADVLTFIEALRNQGDALLCVTDFGPKVSRAIRNSVQGVTSTIVSQTIDDHAIVELRNDLAAAVRA